MNFVKTRNFIYIFTLLVLFPKISMASPDVNPKDPVLGVAINVSEALEILRSTGCVKSYFEGDEIKTEREIARLLIESEECIMNDPNRSCCHSEQSEESSSYKACHSQDVEKCHSRDDFDRGSSNLAKDVFKYLKKQYAYAYQTNKKEVNLNWDSFYIRYPKVDIETLAFKADDRLIPVGGINAFVSPWKSYREGYEFAGGYNFLFSADSSLSIGKWFDASIKPYILTNNTDQDIGLHSGNIKFTIGNFELKAGRSSIYWGQGREARIIYSGNTRPIEMAQISNPYPFKFPWVFKHLGFFNYRLSIGVLENNRNKSHALVFNGRVMLKPSSLFEIGLTRVVQFGGEGAPDYEFWEPIAELFGFRPKAGWIFNIPFSDNAFGTSGIANNLLGLDFRLRVPQLRHSELFLEIYNEDPLDVEDFFPQDTVFHAGFWVPRLNKKGDWQFFIEGMTAARIVYTHNSIFTSGFTNRRRVMGIDQGTDSYGINIQVNKIINLRTKLFSKFGYKYFYARNAGIDEKRFIFKAGLTHLITDAFRFSVNAGVQRINNFNFGATSRTSPFASLGIQFDFDSLK